MAIGDERARTGSADRLLRHDRLIAWNLMRGTFRGWTDRVIAMILLLAAAGVVHAWFADRSWVVTAWTAAAACAAIGIATGRLVAARLAVHVYDGILTADALQPRTRRRYALAVHGLGLALATALTLIARPPLLIVTMPAYLVGALAVVALTGLRIPKRIAGTGRPGWMLRTWSHRPAAGVIAAAILLAMLVPTRTLMGDALAAAIAILTMALSLMLTGVDDAVVRFMTLAGHGSRRIVVHHARSLASFVAVAAPAIWLMSEPVVAGIAAATSGAVVLLLILRILAYRLHARRVADCLVSIVAGLLIVAGYAMPVAVPILSIAIVWHLYRRSRTAAWLLV